MAVSILAGEVVVPVPVSGPTVELPKTIPNGVTCSGDITPCNRILDVLVPKLHAPGTYTAVIE